MAQEKKLNLVILLESEIRKAATLIRIAMDIKKEDPIEKIKEVYANALKACMICLAGAEKENAILLLGSDSSIKGKKEASCAHDAPES